MQIERRTYQTGEVRTAKEADSRTIEGYAALFGSKSQNLGGFREIIQEGAFDEVLQDDVRALFNHKNDHVLARTKSGTLSLSVDSTGLRYSFEAPDTTLGNDLLEMIRRGDISQSSFGFIIDEDKWEEDEEGRTIRTIIKVRRLFDVSPVTFPAYEETEVTVRSRDGFQKKTTLPQTPQRNLRKRKLQLMKLAAI